MTNTHELDDDFFTRKKPSQLDVGSFSHRKGRRRDYGFGEACRTGSVKSMPLALKRSKMNFVAATRIWDSVVEADTGCRQIKAGFYACDASSAHVGNAAGIASGAGLQPQGAKAGHQLDGSLRRRGPVMHGPLYVTTAAAPFRHLRGRP